MSSPAAGASPPSTAALSTNKTPQEQITFRFCRECSNMLYPKEDRMTSKLMFACRTCQFSEEAQSSCVFRNNMYNTVGETAGVTQDVGSDPTVCSPESFCQVICGEGREEGEEGEGEGEGWCCTFCGREVVGGGDGDYKMEEKVETVRGGMIDLAEMSRLEDEEMEMDEEAEDESSQVEQRLDDDVGGDPEHKASCFDLNTAG